MKCVLRHQTCMKMTAEPCEKSVVTDLRGCTARDDLKRLSRMLAGAFFLWRLLPLLIYCQNKWIPAAVAVMGFRLLDVFPCWDNYSWTCDVQRNMSGCFLRINVRGGRRSLKWPGLAETSYVRNPRIEADKENKLEEKKCSSTQRSISVLMFEQGNIVSFEFALLQRSCRNYRRDNILNKFCRHGL